MLNQFIDTTRNEPKALSEDCFVTKLLESRGSDLTQSADCDSIVDMATIDLV